MNKHVQLVYDWIGPEGPWPNAMNHDYYYDPLSFEENSYSLGNPPNQYNLEKHHHSFTYSKLEPILNNLKISYENVSVSNVNEERISIYEITPNFFPEGWLDDWPKYISDVAIKLHKSGKMILVINNLYEGFSNKFYNFFKKLHDAINRYNLDFDQIFYISANMLMSSEYMKWLEDNNITEKINFLDISIFETTVKMHDLKPYRSKHYICLNRSPTPLRQAMVYELWKRDLIKYGYVSFPDESQTSLQTISKEEVEKFGVDISRWDEFIESLPLVVDTDDFTKQDCNASDIHSYYSNAIFSVVLENIYDQSDNIKFTEKTARPLATGSIPLFFNTNGTHDFFNSLGYNTQQPAYDSQDIISVNDKLQLFVDYIENITKKDIDELNSEFKSISQHNFENLKIRKHHALREAMKPFTNKLL